MGLVMAMSRLVSPTDLGVFAMVEAVVGLLSELKDFGISEATVQRASVTHPQLSLVFWANVAAGFGLAAVVAALAPAISWFYSDPRLAPIAWMLACTFVFRGLTVQHEALLRRNMRFFA